MLEKDIFTNLWDQFLDYDYSKEILIGLAVLAVFGGVGGGVYFYMDARDQKAQEYFCDSIQSYDQGLRKFVAGMKKEAKEEWADLEMEFRGAYDQDSGSNLAPYIKMFEVETLVRQGKMGEAVTNLEAAIKKLSSKSPVYNLFSTKLALLQIDQGDAKGLDLLKKLAGDKGNINRDVALYYLGLYYWTNDKMPLAKAEWKELVKEFSADEKGKKKLSPWVKVVKGKLEQIGE